MPKKNQNKKKEQTLTPSDERMLTLLHVMDEAMSAHRCTTVEMLAVARQMTVSALAQLCEDNPQASAMTLIDEVTDTLRRSLTARILQPDAMPVGEA